MPQERIRRASFPPPVRPPFSFLKDFSEKTQDEYNKIRDRNTVLLKEREHLSKLKAEFEAKSIRLGEELNKTLDNMKTLKNQLEKITNGKADTDKENIKSNR